MQKVPQYHDGGKECHRRNFIVKRQAKRGTRKKETLKNKWPWILKQSLIDSSWPCAIHENNLFNSISAIICGLKQHKNASTRTSDKNILCIKTTERELFDCKKECLPCLRTCKWAQSIISSYDECNQGLFVCCGAW